MTNIFKATTEKGNVIFVDVPQEAVSIVHGLREREVLYFDFDKKDYIAIEVPKGRWGLVGRLSSLRENECTSIFEISKHMGNPLILRF